MAKNFNMIIEISQQHVIYFVGAIWIFAGILHHIKCLSRIENFNNVITKLQKIHDLSKLNFAAYPWLIDSHISLKIMKSEVIKAVNRELKCKR